MQVYWTHTTGSGDENGIASFRVTSGGNGSAVSAGGYVGMHTTGSENETNGASAQGQLPLAFVFPVWNSTTSAWDMVVGFAVPHLVGVEAHLWVATA